MVTKQIYEGGCLCGAVRYRVNGQLSDITCCHCSQCRRQTGHHFATTDAKRKDFVLEGADHLVHYRASNFASRLFCKTCGSILFWDEDDAQEISILAGTLDGSTGLKIGRHIFCDDKGDYYELDANTPRFKADI